MQQLRVSSSHVERVMSCFSDEPYLFCRLYFKTHGRDRPQKVIARAIGATRMQKRKAQADQDGGGGGGGSGGNGTKRSKKGGTPLPLRALPPLLPHAPSHPSPLQPMPAFAYGDFVPYGHNGSYGGPAASGSGERGSGSRTSSDGGSVLDGAMSAGGGYGPADYNASGYGGYGGSMNGGHPPVQYDARPFGGQLPPLPPHLQQQQQQQQQQHSQSQPPYPPPYPTSHSQIGRIPRLDTPTDYAAATPRDDVYYDQARGRAGGPVVSSVDAETLQRQALESLAAQALTFGAAGPGPAALAEARSPSASSSSRALQSSLLDESGRPPPNTASARERTLSSSSNVPRAAAADALASMNPAARIQAHDALEQRGQPSPPPSASAMPLGELFPGFSGPNTARVAAQANGASDADDEAT